ncbi:hypothetical protein Nepgr_003692 [Nepenthes gracilis]|uniref:Uncharacterized protein n=1 Tax=Nepenthes gracilis TaxID=150966 RepID=A0AAD3RZZ9_NEPGR|nr:hypothetical protein Nepgr_003692 [Nepenthes gracilis]
MLQSIKSSKNSCLKFSSDNPLDLRSRRRRRCPRRRSEQETAMSTIAFDLQACKTERKAGSSSHDYERQSKKQQQWQTLRDARPLSGQLNEDDGRENR